MTTGGGKRSCLRFSEAVNQKSTSEFATIRQEPEVLEDIPPLTCYFFFFSGLGMKYPRRAWISTLGRFTLTFRR